MVKVVGISGSIRSGSYASHLLDKAMDLVTAKGLKGEVIDLKTLDLPFCDGSETYPNHPDVTRLRETVRGADALILVSPEYHGGVSGVLKNCLDLLTFDEMERKVVAVMSVLGGGQSMNTVDDLRTVCRHLHAWVIPDQIILPIVHSAFDQEGEFLDPRQKERLERVVQDLLIATHKLGL